jgi:hypothetical protein
MDRNRAVVRAICLVGLALTAAGLPVPAGGQEEGAGPVPATAAPGTATPAASPRLSVVACTSNRAGQAQAAGLGDRLTVVASDLPALLARVGGDCQQIVLFLDGIALPGTPAESCDPETGGVRFWLLRSDDNDRQWHALLGSPGGFTRRVPVSLGWAAEFALPTAIDEFSLVVLPRGDFYVFLVLLVAGLVSFLWLARNSDMLRSTAVEPPAGRRAPYSLARVQMAFWFFLVVAAYVFIWLVTEELDTITESVLGLIGIGSGTALGAALIDAGTTQTAPAAPVASGGFFKDILEGPSGMGFHRFQMFAWTLVLGVIFCASVYQTLEMPEFSTTLLALMGISSGTYLGFKFPERQQPQAPPGGASGGPPAPGAPASS